MTIGMLGDSHTVSRLVPIFSKYKVLLEDRNYLTAADIADALTKREDIDCVIIAESACHKAIDGREGVIRDIRNASETVRILFFLSKPDLDRAFQKYCMSKNVPDLFIPDKDGNMNMPDIARTLQKGRLKPQDAKASKHPSAGRRWPKKQPPSPAPVTVVQTEQSAAPTPDAPPLSVPSQSSNPSLETASTEAVSSPLPEAPTVIHNRKQGAVRKMVRIPVERIVKKQIEVPVIREVEERVEVEQIVPKRVEVPVIREVEERVEVEQIVPKRVEVPVTKYVDELVEVEVLVPRIKKVIRLRVEKIVTKRVEIPVIREVEERVEVEQIVTKRVEVPVIREVEERVEVEQIITNRVEVPVERVVTIEIPKEQDIPQPPPPMRGVPANVIIGVFNVSRGAGASSMALALAKEGARRKLRSFLIGLDGSGDYKTIKSPDRRLTILDGEENGILSAVSAGARLIVLDFGQIVELDSFGELKPETVLNHSLFSQLSQCHIVYGMCLSAPWHRLKVEYFTQMNPRPQFIADQSWHKNIANRRDMTPEAILDLIFPLQKQKGVAPVAPIPTNAKKVAT